VRGVAGGLELDGAVLDVEVPGQALLQLVRQPGQVPGVALLAAAHATAARGPVPEAGPSAAATPVAASTPSAARSRSVSSGRVSA